LSRSLPRDERDAAADLTRDASPVSTSSASSSSAVARTRASGSRTLRDALQSLAALRAIAGVIASMWDAEVLEERIDFGDCLIASSGRPDDDLGICRDGHQQHVVLMLGNSLHRDVVKCILGVEERDED